VKLADLQIYRRNRTPRQSPISPGYLDTHNDLITAEAVAERAANCLRLFRNSSFGKPCSNPSVLGVRAAGLDPLKLRQLRWTDVGLLSIVGP
jgi:hypothetical protein